MPYVIMYVNIPGSLETTPYDVSRSFSSQGILQIESKVPHVVLETVQSLSEYISQRTARRVGGTSLLLPSPALPLSPSVFLHLFSYLFLLFPLLLSV